jgi:hypothetical protein
MDKTTVLEIIKIVDYEATLSQEMVKSRLDFSFATRQYYQGKVNAYEALSYHLQKFIENEVNKIEL